MTTVVDQPTRDAAEAGAEESQPRAKRPGWTVFRREERHEIRYQIAIWGATFLSWLAWTIPQRIRMRVADIGGDLYFRFFSTYRANVQSNLAQVTGNPEDSPQVRTLARSVFRISSRNFADLLVVPRQSKADLRRNVSFIEGDWKLLDDAIAQGRGVVLVTAHLGCFDYAGQILTGMGYPIQVVTGRTTSRFLFDAVSHLRSSQGMRLWEPNPSGVRRIIHALRREECAVFVADRDFFQNGKTVNFFGRETTLPPGAVRIARDTQAMVLTMFALRTEQGTGFIMKEAFTIPKTNDLEADLLVGLNKLVGYFEEAIGTYPEQWVTFQRVWPSEPADPFRVFPVGSPMDGQLLERIDAALARPARKQP